MRICKHCGINDDRLTPGTYWVNDHECSGCAKEEAGVLTGINDEYAGERPGLISSLRPIPKPINGKSLKRKN